MDLAASVQEVTEEVMLRMARHVHRETGMKNLCLAGGVALNCVGNGRLLREGPFERHLDPARRGRRRRRARRRARSIWHQLLGKRAAHAPSRRRACTARYLGPAFADDEIAAFLDVGRAPSTEQLATRTTLIDARRRELLADEKVVGWFQGRMEFGPRALGAPQHPRRPALAEDAVGDEPEDQVPRELPAVRAVVLREHVRGVVRARRRLALHAARRAGARRSSASR